MELYNGVIWKLLLVSIIYGITEVYSGDSDYNVIHNDGSYEFGGDSPDSYHYAVANRNNVVKGEFGERNPKSGGIDRTVYTAGPRGYRPRGKNIVRKYDLNQSGPRPVGSPDDPYYDPYEDPSYHFGFKTRTHSREEDANRVGDVTGRYSYVDDVGERHNVEYIAGRRTGFHVKTPFPDSNPRAYGPLYFRGRGRPIPRGRTSVQRGLDGSYKFVSAGPDQRRTEVSDATGHVRGSYTYLDEKGIQHSVHYIAGPETGYRVLKNVKGPHLPTIFPFGRPDILSPDFYDDFNKDVGDLFGTNGNGVGGNPTASAGGTKPGAGTTGGGINLNNNDDDKFGDDGIGGRPISRPTVTGGGNNYDDDYDLFGDSNKRNPGGSTTTSRPSTLGSYKPTTAGYPSSTTSGPIDFGSVFSPGDFSTSGYGGGLTTPGYGGSPTTPTYGDSSSTPGFESGNDGGNSYPGDTGRPEIPLSEYGPPGFGKPGSGIRPGRPGTGARPSGPGNYDFNGLDDDFGLFGSPSEHGVVPSRKPNLPSNGPSLQVGGSVSANDPSCEKCKGTLVTNVGDRTFTVPPGVSVRAHVQAIDLIPYESKVPSPSAQMRADSIAYARKEELSVAEDNIVNQNIKTEKIEQPPTTNSTESTDSVITGRSS